MLRIAPPPGDGLRDKFVALGRADVLGVYDQIRFALTRAAIAAEGRPARTVDVVLRPDGADWRFGGGAPRFWTPRIDALPATDAVYSAALSSRADALLTRWNALVAALLREIEAQLRADGVTGEWFVAARGHGPLGVLLADVLALSRLERVTVQRALAPRKLRSRAFLLDDEEENE